MGFNDTFHTHFVCFFGFLFVGCVVCVVFFFFFFDAYVQRQLGILRGALTAITK